MDKRRMFFPEDLSKTRYEMVTNAVVIQYSGWVALEPIIIKVNYKT